MSLFGFFSGQNKSPHQLLGEGKLKPALKGFIQLHEAKPSEPIFTVQIATIYMKMKQPAKALPYYILVGNHFMKRGFINKAVASFKKALNIDPENEEVIAKLGELTEEASRFMLNDSFFMKKEDVENLDKEEAFDITQEDASLADESLHLELEQASSEIDSLSLKTLPDFGFDGVREQIKEAVASKEKKAEPSTTPLEPEKAKTAAEITAQEEVVATQNDEVQSVFKNRIPQTETASTERETDTFSNLDDALDAAFSFEPQKIRAADKPGLLNDPDRWALFKGIDRETFMDIVKALKSKTFEPGDYIIKQGDEGDEMFLIVEGEVEVYIQVDELSKKVAILKSGEFFGEGAILTKSKRNADLRALVQTEVLTLSKPEFIGLVKKHPRILANMKLPFISRKKVNKSIIGD